MTTIDLNHPLNFQVEIKAKASATEDEIKQLIANQVEEVKVLNVKLISNDLDTEVFIRTGDEVR